MRMRWKWKRALAALLAALICCCAAQAEPDAAAGLPDGVYAPEGFAFSGGSGRITITCDQVRVSDGNAWARITFSSPNYPLARVGGTEYETVQSADTSAVEVPVTLNRDCVIEGLTTAMSADHWIAYTIRVTLGAGETPDEELPGLTWESRMPLEYARRFTIDCYEGGYRYIRIEDGDSILVVPEGLDAPEGLPGDVIVLRRPVQNVYLAATSAMALIDALDALDAVRMSSLQASDWTVENARAAMERGEILFAGKYSEPDYEMLLRQECGLALESTMIFHTPKVREMIELLGIPVIVDRSSYEDHPMGRTEWIKLYGALLDREAEADAFFTEQAQTVRAYEGFENTGRTVAFFSVRADGSVTVRAASDYIPKMIEIAGGRYALSDVVGSDDGRSSVNVTMEQFYDAALDADFLIYNAAIDDPLTGMDDLLAKSALFADFRAVREGHVWSTGKDLYQASDEVSGLITDLHRMLTGEYGDMRFLTRVE